VNGGTLLRSLLYARSRMTSWQSKAAMSALPPKADITERSELVRFARQFGRKGRAGDVRCGVHCGLNSDIA
jgi:hypothetical protein